MMLSPINQQLNIHFTQMIPSLYLHMTTSLSHSPTILHIHLTQFFQMILLKNILNPKTTSILLIKTWILCYMSKPQSPAITQLLHHHLPPNIKSSLRSSKKPMSLVLSLPYILLNAIWFNNHLPLHPHHPPTLSHLRIMSTIVLVVFFSKNKPLLSMSTSPGLSISSQGLLHHHHKHNNPTLPLQVHPHQPLQTLQTKFPQKSTSIEFMLHASNLQASPRDLKMAT